MRSVAAAARAVARVYQTTLNSGQAAAAESTFNIGGDYDKSSGRETGRSRQRGEQEQVLALRVRERVHPPAAAAAAESAGGGGVGQGASAV